MSTFNKIFIQGIVNSEPTYHIDKQRGKVVYVPVKIHREDINKDEIITLSSKEPEIITSVLNTVHEGDGFIVNKARLITVNYEKDNEIECPNCNELFYHSVKAEKTEVEFYEYKNIPNASQNELAFNKIYLMGTVCSDLNSRVMPNGKSYVKYKVAVSRFGKASAEQEYDFPYIVSFGKEADSATKHLTKGRTVLVDGAIQERQIVQKVECRCPHCQQVSITPKNSFVREIITNNVEYLKRIEPDMPVESLQENNSTEHEE